MLVPELLEKKEHVIRLYVDDLLSSHIDGRVNARCMGRMGRTSSVEEETIMSTSGRPLTVLQVKHISVVISNYDRSMSEYELICTYLRMRFNIYFVVQS